MGSYTTIMERVYIVHGWDGSPNEPWFVWLKNQLNDQDFEVSIPAMPTPDWPNIDTWPEALAKAVGSFDSDTFLVGHSVGCQTIIRFLSGSTEGEVGGMVLVAPWFRLSKEATTTDKEERIAEPWENTQDIDFARVISAAPKRITLFSEDDPDVPYLENRELFKHFLKLSDNNILTETNKGHFSPSDGVTEIPIVLQKLLEMSNRLPGESKAIGY